LGISEAGFLYKLDALLSPNQQY